MYLFLVWTIEPGPTPAPTIEAELTARLATIQPQCIIVPSGAILMPSTGGDAEYEDLFEDLQNIREAYDQQFRFALTKSKERYLRGEGFDTALAWQIIK
jgi:hypothetical protein